MPRNENIRGSQDSIWEEMGIGVNAGQEERLRTQVAKQLNQFYWPAKAEELVETKKMTNEREPKAGVEGLSFYKAPGNPLESPLTVDDLTNFQRYHDDPRLHLKMQRDNQRYAWWLGQVAKMYPTGGGSGSLAHQTKRDSFSDAISAVALQISNGVIISPMAEAAQEPLIRPGSLPSQEPRRDSQPKKPNVLKRALALVGLATVAGVGGGVAAQSGALGPDAKQTVDNIFGVATTVTVEPPTIEATEIAGGGVTATQGGVESTITPATETQVPTDVATETAYPEGAYGPEMLSTITLEDNLPIEGLGHISQSLIPDAVIQSLISGTIGGSVEQSRKDIEQYGIPFIGYNGGYKDENGFKYWEILDTVDKDGNSVDPLISPDKVAQINTIKVVLHTPNDKGFGYSDSVVVVYGKDQSVSEKKTESTKDLAERLKLGQKVLIIGGTPANEAGYYFKKYLPQKGLSLYGTEAKGSGQSYVAGASWVVISN